MPAIDRIVVECSFAKRLAGFWAAATGYTLGTVTRPGRAALEHPDGRGPRMFFVEVDGRRRGARGPAWLGVDLIADDPDAEAAVLRDLGAKLVGVADQDGEACVVMRDPEGNPFRIFGLRDHQPPQPRK